MEVLVANPVSASAAHVSSSMSGSRCPFSAAMDLKIWLIDAGLRFHMENCLVAMLSMIFGRTFHGTTGLLVSLLINVVRSICLNALSVSCKVLCM